jgi:hypothetical protein
VRKSKILKRGSDNSGARVKKGGCYGTTYGNYRALTSRDVSKTPNESAVIEENVEKDQDDRGYDFLQH